jgi:hypothetical protein
MRASEFLIKEAGSLAPSAPSLSDPKKQDRAELLKNLGQQGVKPTGTTKDAQPGFLGGLAQGFKQGMGMDADKSMASNLASAGLEKLGMRNAASANDKIASISSEPSQQSSQTIKPGQSIKDPISGRGNVKVLANPGGRGIKLDTTRSLGYPIIVDPKDLA